MPVITWLPAACAERDVHTQRAGIQSKSLGLYVSSVFSEIVEVVLSDTTSHMSGDARRGRRPDGH